jgi:hypothetical protein
MMQRVRAGLAGALLALAALAVPGSTTAQDYQTSVGWGGGYFMFQPFVDASPDTPELGFGGTWVAVLQAETWRFNRWVGLRAGGFLSNGTIDYPDGALDHSIYGVEAAALVRVVPPREGRRASAYVLGGGGVTWFSMGDAPGEVPIPGTNVIYDPDEARQYVVLGGGGVEVLTGLRFFDGDIGLRAEAVDNIALNRPLHVSGQEADMMHNLRFTLALFTAAPSLF